MSSLLGILVFCFAVAFAVLAFIFLVVPLLRGLGWAIGGVFNGIAWLLRHTFEFIGGMLGDVVRFVGAMIAWVVLTPMVLLSVVIGRWSAAGHYWRCMKRECGVANSCLYRVLLQRPLRFLLLGGLLEGIEQRVGDAVEAAPSADKPRRRAGRFDGYTITGSLPGGGSGAKLYIAEPDAQHRARNPHMPDRVVIKSFAISDGSTLPQIVRESRALEAAKQLGLVLDHGMDEQRFFYVMPYHHGDHLGIITRQLHGQSDGRGFDRRQLDVALAYLRDLLGTLARYHEGGLWHKDVKPDNVIVHDGRAHLVDLGLVTPLRSAMTLTTHGTEYFRDPEMVRMALRGVKVHQVDGAKFDIYAAGAVLYFMLENTFPAHGGLSTFSKKSPEAARWIVRRAMADYNKRYDKARQMLADVTHIATAADPFAVKPAQLPSMAGETPEPGPEAEPAPSTPQPEVIASAASPVPPDRGQVQGPDGPGQFVWPARAETPQPTPAVAEQPQPARRPRLRVTNWWTGAYKVLDNGIPAAEAAADRVEARTYRDELRGLRRQARELRHQVRNNAVSARRAAREQIREARSRAREIQRRARTQRHRPVPVAATREPSGMMAFLALAVVAGIAVIGWGLVKGYQSSRYGVEQVFAADGPQDVNISAGISGPLSLLIINDHPAGTNDRVLREIERIATATREQGWEVVMNDADREVEVRKVLPAGEVVPDDSNPLLRATLRNLGLDGIIRVRSYPGAGDPASRIRATVVALPEDEQQRLLAVELRAADGEPEPFKATLKKRLKETVTR